MVPVQGLKAYRAHALIQRSATRLSMTALFTTVCVLSGCKPFVDWSANKVYASLSEPWESEAPRTFTSYPSSPTTQAIIGAGGRSLDCSIPSWADIAFRRPSSQLSDVRLRFRQACVLHDFCYRHGLATYGYTQNDCDVMLQQSSYRLCRQVFAKDSTDSPGKPSSDNPFSFCETEAKKVLLGVALGGAGSYMGPDRSTYFEYDPMPYAADDYVIARAVPPGSHAGAPAADMGIRTFYFKRNTVTMSALVERDGLASTWNTPNVVPFPDRRIATPPQWAHSPGAPMLASVARDNFANTSVRVFKFLYDSPSPDSPFVIESCDPQKGMQCSQVGDVSVSKLAVVGQRAGLLSLSHRGCLPPRGNKTCPGVTPELVWQDFGSPNVERPYQFDTRSVQGNARFLQHDFLLENDATGSATHAWVLARGITVTPDGHDYAESVAGSATPCSNAVADYRECVAVTRQELKPGGTVERSVIRAREKNEPLSVIRLADGSPLLVGLEWDDTDFDRVVAGKLPRSAPAFRYWSVADALEHGSAGHTAPLPDETKDGFMDMPATIANVSGTGQPILVLTRINAAAREETGSAQEQAKTDTARTFDDEHATIEVLVARIDGGAGKTVGVTQTGRAYCSINLRDQLFLQDSRGARMITEHANRSYDQPATSTIKVGSAEWRKGLLELAQRWKMSQVLVSESPDDNAAELMLVTIVFKGFTDMSVQLRLHTNANEARFSAQRGGKRFASCGEGKAPPLAPAN
ncbi:hypothetical protein ACFQ3P_25680 [Paraburkholderia sabiae]|uniref:Uncharacterized protein n=1 Tax=Paraburkholderia sabiae TaxID=273251 RepID=A0ABU9QLU1_9BURK|nr:hypothetical protein [Paraburkholderia sabiae]WJZ77304.1 hypothetical protein QEN71_35115 [Paraburkholderia sabiae]CAD6548006.1 hypothetical protein LMG24235_04516 [Paraburkholderia sabiae]